MKNSPQSPKHQNITNMFTPIKQYKTALCIPKYSGSFKKLPQTEEIEGRLKNNIGIIEHLNQSEFQRYKQRKKTKSLGKEPDNLSQKKKILHNISEKLKWKDSSRKQRPVSPHTDIGRSSSVDEKLDKIKETLGRIKQFNQENMQSLNRIKNGNQTSMRPTQSPQKYKINILHTTPEKRQSQKYEQPLNKSKLLIEKYEKHRKTSSSIKTKYSGSVLKGEYRHPQYIKPLWMKSNQKPFSNLSDLITNEQNYILNTSEWNLDTSERQDRCTEDCKCTCHL